MIPEDGYKKVSAEDMLGRLMKKEGFGALDDDKALEITERELAMAALKLANSLMNILVVKDIVSPEELLAMHSMTSEILDHFIDMEE